MTSLTFHPYADLFPLIEGADFEAFCASFRRDGYDRRQPIVTYGNQILDGRNRYRACEATGVAAQFREFDPGSEGSALDFVIRMNLPRRHLNESQRAAVAADLATMRQGERTDLEPSANLQKVAQGDAAKRMSVSERLVSDAVKVRREAPEVFEAVRRGAVPASTAARIVDLPPETRKQIIEAPDPARAARTAVKKADRVERERQLGGKQHALPDQKFGVILADPEWKWKPWSEAGMDRGVENTYPTSETTDIAARDVQSIAADDCVLVLWARADMLPEALQVMVAWGFRYVAQRVWRKSRMSTGYWFRYDHELVLIGSRGKPVAPAMGTQERSVFEGDPAVPGLNSSKPECIAEWIERNWPNTPKIEMNRRGPARPGWAAWGNETITEAQCGGADRTTPAVPSGDEPQASAQTSHSCEVGAAERPNASRPPQRSHAKADDEYADHRDAQGSSAGGMTVSASRTVGGSDAPGVPSSPPCDSLWAGDDGLDIPNFLRRDSVTGRAPFENGSSPAAPWPQDIRAADLAAGERSANSPAALSPTEVPA